MSASKLDENLRQKLYGIDYINLKSPLTSDFMNTKIDETNNESLKKKYLLEMMQHMHKCIISKSCESLGDKAIDRKLKEKRKPVFTGH